MQTLTQNKKMVIATFIYYIINMVSSIAFASISDCKFLSKKMVIYL